MNTPVRNVLAKNLRDVMKRTKTLSTQESVAKKAKIAQTSVGNMLNVDNPNMKSPKLDQVEKVASAFGLATWQLLLDPGTVGKGLSDLLLRPAVQDDDARLTDWDTRNTKKGGQ